MYYQNIPYMCKLHVDVHVVMQNIYHICIILMYVYMYSSFMDLPKAFSYAYVLKMIYLLCFCHYRSRAHTSKIPDSKGCYKCCIGELDHPFI